MAKDKVIFNDPFADHEPASPCPSPKEPILPSLSQLSTTSDAISISEAADKIADTSQRLGRVVTDCARVERTFTTYKAGCDSLISDLNRLSSNLKEVMEAAHQPVWAGLSEETRQAVNAIPGNIAKAVTDEICQALRTKISHEVNEGFKRLEKRRKVCAMPWPVAVPVLSLLIALIMLSILVYKEADRYHLIEVLSIYQTIMGWFAAIIILVAIIYCIWLSCR